MRVHLNTARAHLRALESAGIVERIVPHEGRPGRPTVRYLLRRGFVPSGDELLPLTALLAEALAGFDPIGSRMRDVALEWGRNWSRQMPGEEPETRLRAALERLGFAVNVDPEHVRLDSCPCPLVARERPQMICQLADAVADGVLEGSSVRAAHRAHDPRARRCTATLIPA
jgi:predicted ArsR family transcriptional regulator